MDAIDYIDWDEGREDLPVEETDEAEVETVNAHVHSTFAPILNSWASIGNGLYVRTGKPRRKR